MWQLLKVLLRLTSDPFVLFIQQQAKISTDTERHMGLLASFLAIKYIKIIHIKTLTLYNMSRHQNCIFSPIHTAFLTKQTKLNIHHI